MATSHDKAPQQTPPILGLPVGLPATGSRTEIVSRGAHEVPADKYWGARTLQRSADRSPMLSTTSSLPAIRRIRHRRLRGHTWSAPQKAVLIASLAIVMGCLFLLTYSRALGDPTPRHIDTGIVGEPETHASTVQAVQRVSDDSLTFHRYASVPAARQAIDQQRIYAALDLSGSRPTLYVASAAGVSVARVLERTSAVDPRVRVVDTHPLAGSDPNGLDVFYTMLVATIVGMITVFQVRANAPGLLVRHHVAFVVGLALSVSLALTFVGGVLHGFSAADPEAWGILSLQVVAAGSFSSLMAVIMGRWAILPTWLFFTILGNSASGGAVSPALLPAPFAFLSQWLPSGATVTALRDAVYFPGHQHLLPFVVLAAWALVLFVTWSVIAYHRETQEDTTTHHVEVSP